MASTAEVTGAAPRRRSVWSMNSTSSQDNKKYTTPPRQQDRKLSSTPARARREEQFLYGKGRTYGARAIIGFLLLASGIGIGLGVGSVIFKTMTVTGGNYWRPATGATIQVELLYPLNDTSADALVYNIDLYNNTPTTIANLHSLGKKVICYISAGTYEDSRPDKDLFKSSDYGNDVVRYPGRKWLDTRSWNVRTIMKARLDLAVAKGCDGIDPDGTDGYSHDSGFTLTKDTALDYVQFLATETHARNMSLGLRNSPELVTDTLGVMQWSMNENCEVYTNCATYRSFLTAGKPVFHIVYPGVAVSASLKTQYCNTADTTGFSTILKNMVLDTWIAMC